MSSHIPVRTLIAALALLLFAAAPVSAQSSSRPVAEVSAAFSWLPANGDDFPRPDSPGLLAGAALHVTDWFALVGELGWYRGTGRDLGPGFPGLVAETQVRQYLAGGRFTARLTGVDVFAHGLVGQSVGDAGPGFEGFSDSGLTFGGGGGIDVAVGPRLAARAQFDLLGSFADIVDVNPRMSGGVVVRF